MKVSVIVPVYNPGRHIDDCIASLLDQSLPSDEYEAIFVDDGSTDDTPARLDALAREHPNVRVEHIPNSGWPGRPRNVGIGMARGEFIYFVDNDDYIGREALERLHATAVRDSADVVIGKVVGHGRRTSRPMFRQNRSGLGIETPLLLAMLTPHKLFRRAFLEEHAIRFPEGRVRLEDHIFVLHAYLHTNSVSILADYPCYHWVLRGHDKNASSGKFEPVGYFKNLRDVLDLLDEHLEPGPLRDKLYAHWYRTKLLGRVGGAAFLRREPEYGAQLYEEIRRLALERFDAGTERYLSFTLKLRAALLKADRVDALRELARMEGALRARVRAVDVATDDGRIALHLRAGIVGPRYERRGERIFIVLPSDVADALPEERLDATWPMGHSKLDVMLRSSEHGEFLIAADAELELGDGDGEVEPVLDAHAVVDPATAAAGKPLRPGEWEVYARVTIGGYQAEKPVRHPATHAPLVLQVDAGGRARIAGLGLSAFRRRLGLARRRLLRR